MQRLSSKLKPTSDCPSIIRAENEVGLTERITAEVHFGAGRVETRGCSVEDPGADSTDPRPLRAAAPGQRPFVFLHVPSGIEA